MKVKMIGSVALKDAENLYPGTELTDAKSSGFSTRSLCILVKGRQAEILEDKKGDYPKFLEAQKKEAEKLAKEKAAKKEPKAIQDLKAKIADLESKNKELESENKKLKGEIELLK